ncbi:hypothetical protein [Paractinoplanes durhamensis]|uniref:Uncharacterized protein n=1 Tax=Paractinoplanes durhamensis TaxID=113563 RepID=A0ABQ3Z0V0_9ACTN|nr:hypothetical protein [Actinoplanes durhamensis]GIE03457.1 hypothetical protein Adu01nite_48070 [Actinoplanes durhamensis]
MDDRPENISARLLELLGYELPPDQWAKARRIAEDFSAALMTDRGYEAIASRLDLLYSRRLSGAVNPRMGDRRAQAVDETTQDVIIRVTREAERRRDDTGDAGQPSS